jgi:hypothetical protein
MGAGASVPCTLLNAWSAESMGELVSGIGTAYVEYGLRIAANGISGDVIASLDTEEQILSLLNKLQITDDVHQAVITSKLKGLKGASVRRSAMATAQGRVADSMAYLIGQGLSKEEAINLIDKELGNIDKELGNIDKELGNTDKELEIKLVQQKLLLVEAETKKRALDGNKQGASTNVSDTTPTEGNNPGVSSTSHLKDSIQKLVSSGVKIIVNSQRYTYPADLVSLLRGGLPEFPTELLDYVDEIESENLNALISLCTALKSTSELTGQKAVNKYVERLKAVDSSTDGSLGLFFLPRSVGGYNAVYPLTAKADFVSKLCPMLLELKNSGLVESTRPTDVDVESLFQAVDRVFTFRATSGLIKDAVVLASSGRCGWLLRFSRDIHKYSDEDFEILSITRLNHLDIWRAWTGYTNMSMRCRQWYLSPDARHLSSTLAAITHPFCCIVRLVASSRHRVYAVSFPRLFEEQQISGARTRTFGATPHIVDICIKVIDSSADYLKESAISLSVCAESLRQYPALKHYLLNVHNIAHGAFATMRTPRVDEEQQQYPTDSYQQSAARYLESVIKKSVVATELTPQAMLSYSKLDWMSVARYGYEGVAGGTLVMRPGELVPLSNAILESWCGCVFRDLQIVHDAGYVHCDVRPSNVLKFDHHYRLIDYDLALDKKNSEFTFKPGSQFEYRPAQYKHAQVGDKITWTPQDDISMITAVITKELVK